MTTQDISPTWVNAQNYIQEMAPVVRDMAYEVVVDGFIFGKPTWLSRTVEDWTNRAFQEHTAKVVSAVILAMPFLAVNCLCPRFIYTPTFLTCIGGRIYNACTHSLPQGDIEHSFRDMNNGAALPLLADGTREIVIGIIKKNALQALGGAVELLSGMCGLLQSHFLSDLVLAVQDAYDQVRTIAWSYAEPYLPCNEEERSSI